MTKEIFVKFHYDLRLKLCTRHWSRISTTTLKN